MKKIFNSFSSIIYCSIILLLAVIIAGLCVSVKDVANTAVVFLAENVMTIAVSIICSILASAIYANMFEEKSSEEKKIFKCDIKKDIEETIDKAYDEKIDDGINKVIAGVADVYHNTKDMSPSRYFASSDTPNKEFNAYLDRKISESRKFVYFGASAMYACYRLYKLKQQMPNKANLNIEIFIANPAGKEIFKDNEKFIRVKEQNRDPASKRKIQTIVKEEKENILSCLFALEEMKDDFNDINIYMVQRLPFINIEMTDDMLALEFFRTRKDFKRYPLTIIYEGNNTLYDGYEFNLEWEREKAEHIKKSELTQDYIKKLGEEAGLGVLTDEQLKEYRNKMLHFVTC